MKRLENFLGLAAIIIVFGYITYSEVSIRRPVGREDISDEYIAAEFPLMEGQVTALTFDLPPNVSFANEPVPMTLPDVRERLDKELQINIYLHSNTLFLIKRANRWLPQIQAILRSNGIPDDFKYLPLIESNLMNVISPKEAAGYWQILKTSGKEFGLEITGEVDERYDPLKATSAACKYLKQAYQRFGNWTLVAASYNRGMSGIQRAIDSQDVNSYYDLYLNDETSRYVFRILAIKEIINNPDRYGFKVSRRHLYGEEKIRHIEVDKTIRDLVSFAKEHGTNYKMIKRHNAWLREDKLTVKKGKRYKIAIPMEED